MKLNDPLLFRQQCYINGEWCHAENGEVFTVTNPATQTKIGSVPKMGALETHRAIECAEDAWVDWRDRTAKERSQIVRNWYDLIVQHHEDLAVIMTTEQGKPLEESRGEITYGAGFVEWFAEEAKRAYGDVIPSNNNDRRVVIIKQPIGVVAAITPWNFPSSMITRKCAPALAAGCPVVVKPASETPYSALALAVLAERAGVPKGIFNVVTGDARNIGGELTSNPIVRKLSFTGSTPVGKILLSQCAATVKKVSMELGGNAPFIVFNDANIDEAVSGAMASKFRNTGQTCVCANRLFVEDDIYDVFAAKLKAAVEAMAIGNGLEGEVQQGPLINEDAVLKVEEHIADAVSKGAELITGGRRHALGGTFFEPAVLTGVTTDMMVAKEETFGPMAPLFRFKGEREVIRMANDTEYGLAAYVYTRDIGRIWRVSEQLEYGMIGINEGIISSELAPFGGIKESGIGREGSKYGLDEYLEVKYLCMGGLDK
ncbi:MAG: NAD-dependent succinate-semialdehyde dehydrogenase [Robiginitomaculum sp.]